jgi:hypothetical protein
MVEALMEDDTFWNVPGVIKEDIVFKNKLEAIRWLRAGQLLGSRDHVVGVEVAVEGEPSCFS